jgi:hypothetical protein
MKLSVCCLTRDQPSMVAATLALFRPVADEIVVAVDSRVDPGTLGSPTPCCGSRIQARRNGRGRGWWHSAGTTRS